MWFIGVEEEQETSAPPPKKNPGSAPAPPVYRRKRHRAGLFSTGFFVLGFVSLIKAKRGNMPHIFTGMKPFKTLFFCQW